jgi:mycofactocin precursor
VPATGAPAVGPFVAFEVTHPTEPQEAAMNPEPQADLDTLAEALAEALVEDVSIDGMCGVY